MYCCNEHVCFAAQVPPRRCRGAGGSAIYQQRTLALTGMRSNLPVFRQRYACLGPKQFLYDRSIMSYLTPAVYGLKLIKQSKLLN